MFKKTAVGLGVDAVVRDGRERNRRERAVKKAVENERSRNAAANQGQVSALEQKIRTLAFELELMNDVHAASLMIQGRLERLVRRGLVLKEAAFVNAGEESLQRWFENDVKKRMIEKFGESRADLMIREGLVQLDLRLDQD